MWENIYSCTMANTVDSSIDYDSDLLTSLDEYSLSTDPCEYDTDGDEMGDGFENLYAGCAGLDPLAAGNTILDGDTDGLSNLAEHNAGTNPCNEDTDSDGMNDNWEILYGSSCGLNPVLGDSLGDNDGDGLPNLSELAAATQPCHFDTDADGMPDGWEVMYSLDPLTDDSAGDPDNDSLTNIIEYSFGTDPQSADTDNDNMPDDWEESYACVNSLFGDSTQDPDNDLYANLDEFNAATNPCSQDTDGDGMPDGWEAANSLDPLSGDSADDPDADSLSNLQEYIAGTNPQSNDTDGDNMPDSWEVLNGASCALSPIVGDSLGDGDSDGLSNISELNLGTAPCNEDTDNDGCKTVLSSLTPFVQASIH